LNLGIEAGELAIRKPSKWPKFAELFDYVRTALKQEYPNVKIGISFGLQALMSPDVSQLVKPVVNNSDYLCLSFYPNMSKFGEKFGAPALPDGNASWLKPLSWVHGYTDKPIAICETGYSSKPVNVEGFNLNFPGDADVQSAYLLDLISLAKRDNYLFVIWFLAIDYDKLYAKLPDPDGVNKIWRNIGLLDGDLNPKPAWAIWQSQFGKGPTPIAPQLPTQSQPILVAPQNVTVVNDILFQNAADTLLCGPNNHQSVDETQKVLSWHEDFRDSGWSWCVKPISPPPVSANSFRIQIRSDVGGQFFVKLEEINKESFYTVLDLTPQWQDLEINFSNFQLDNATRQNGVIDSENVKKIVLADHGKGTNSRMIQIRQIQFLINR
jgi:hypothetical protein